MVLGPWLVEAESRPDKALTEMTAHRDRLRDETDRLSFSRSALPAVLKKPCRQLSAVRGKVGTVRGHMNEQKRLRKEAGREVGDIPYDLSGA